MKFGPSMFGSNYIWVLLWFGISTGSELLGQNQNQNSRTMSTWFLHRIKLFLHTSRWSLFLDRCVVRWIFILHCNFSTFLVSINAVYLIYLSMYWVVSLQLFGFLNMGLSAASLWFLFKETDWHKGSAASDDPDVYADPGTL